MTDRNKVQHAVLYCCLFKIFNIGGLFCQYSVLKVFMLCFVNTGLVRANYFYIVE